MDAGKLLDVESFLDELGVQLEAVWRRLFRRARAGPGLDLNVSADEDPLPRKVAEKRGVRMLEREYVQFERLAAIGEGPLALNPFDANARTTRTSQTCLA